MCEGRKFNKQKNKGDKAEREAAELLAEATGFSVRRKLGAGRQDDVGDLDGIPETVIQIASYSNPNVPCLKKPREVEEQRKNAKAKFAASIVRWPRVRGPDKWRVVLTIPQFAKLLMAALKK